MGIVKIDDDLHEEVRKASTVLCRSINAQAEYWMKIGMLAEANPTLSLNDILRIQLKMASVRLEPGQPPQLDPVLS
ncbi:ParD-like family protein [Azospirillum sp. B4]|uniref:ParD-like family protein n=1 Tax=Azospirillum sp. B4 TaxID=95605 RepID=UPI000345BBD4|nr:ParD-like family protein [Azospirillum sp. B4]